VQSLSLQRAAGWKLLAGWGSQEHGWPLDVRLKGVDTGGPRAGKWTDAATGEHGDLLDVIRVSCGLVDFHDVTEEARRFLSLPRSERKLDCRPRLSPVPAGSPDRRGGSFALLVPEI
jgi:hypothetical protein